VAFETRGSPLQMHSPIGRHASPTKLFNVHQRTHASVSGANGWE
jgi:hypothetical protein